MANSQTPAAAAADGPVGIGGWLVLPVIGLGLTLVQTIPQIGPLFELLRLFPNLDLFQQLVGLFEIVGSLIIYIISPIALLILLGNKKRSFPRLYVFWAFANLIFVAVDLLATYLVFGEFIEASGEPFFDRETMRAILSAVILAAVWVPYMIQSRRVRNTFVN
jgi:hypothetical protein